MSFVISPIPAERRRRLPRDRSGLCTRGPVRGYAESGTYPAGFRHRQQVLRGYDVMGRIVDALLVEGLHAEAGIDQLLARPDVATVHSRNVLYGCYMFAIDRS